VSLSNKKTTAQLNPDTAFICALNGEVDGALKKCIQCGTCSAVCAVSPSASPFPRKEMAKAGLGMKDALFCSPDIWLCYQCNDCTRNCPRGARPGDVLAAIRKKSIVHFAFPRFLAAWVARPRFLPVLFVFPALLLGAAVLFQDKLAAALHIKPSLENEIVYSHSSFLPHRLLNLFFFSISALSVSVMIVCAVRFWRALKKEAAAKGEYKKTRSIGSSIAFALKQILTHEKFSQCEAVPLKRISHFCVLFGFVALVAVDVWVITARWNPLVTSRFVYPLSFLSPFKILANLGGAALLLGCLMMILERLKPNQKTGKGVYFDWLFLLTLVFIIVTGFATEGLHLLRLTPHRHVVYFMHLVSAAALLLSLPFTKFAHMVYRTAAVVFAAHIGREEETYDSALSPEKGEGDGRA
jgi:quinone-modifying oxidoreductase, subunit QmoC